MGDMAEDLYHREIMDTVIAQDTSGFLENNLRKL